MEEIKSIRLDGAIGDLLNTAEAFKLRVGELQLKDTDQLEVVVNSQGGSVLEGYAIYNYLRNLPNRVFVSVEGFAASIATLISLAADKQDTSISEVSMWMIHRSSVGVEGNQEELADQIKILDSIDNTLAEVYAERTGLPKDTLIEMMSKETWLSGKEAVEAGFIGVLKDRISADVMAKVYNKQIKTNMGLLDDMLAKFKADATAETEAREEEKVTAEAVVAEKKEEDEEAKAEVSGVTMEMHMELVEAVAKLTASLEPRAEKEEDEEAKKEQEKAAEAHFESIIQASVSKAIGELKSSNGQVPVGEPKEKGYTSPVSNFLAMQKERDLKTRNK